MRLKNVLYGLSFCMCVACTGKQQERKVDVDEALNYCEEQVHRALSEFHNGDSIDYTLMPKNILSGQNSWFCKPAESYVALQSVRHRQLPWSTSPHAWHSSGHFVARWLSWPVLHHYY